MSDEMQPTAAEPLPSGVPLGKLEEPEEAPLREPAMCWSELERLVTEAETDFCVRQVLQHCRSRDELVLAARRLGFRISQADLRRARDLHQRGGAADSAC
jgi:hypothetical protein